jgi:outer membrane protein W
MSLRPVVIAAALGLLSLPLLAQSSDIGIWAVESHFGGSTQFDPTTRIELKEKIGYGVSFNHFWGEHFSTDLMADATKNDAALTIGGIRALDLGSLKQTVFAGVLQWHFSRRSRLDPYIGLGAAYVTTDDLRSSDLDLAGIGTITVDNKVSGVANAGVSLGLTRAIALAFDARYIPLKPKAAGTTGAAQSLELNPFLYALGLRFRF